MSHISLNEIEENQKEIPIKISRDKISKSAFRTEMVILFKTEIQTGMCPCFSVPILTYSFACFFGFFFLKFCLIALISYSVNQMIAYLALCHDPTLVVTCKHTHIRNPREYQLYVVLPFSRP